MAQFAIDEVLTTGIQISGFIFDYSNRLGTAGQVLTSTTSGVMWQADSSIVDLSSLSGLIAATGTLLNNRINSLSGYVNNTFLSGSGTQYYVPRWDTSKGLITGSIYDNGFVGIGITNPSGQLHLRNMGFTSQSGIPDSNIFPNATGVFGLVMDHNVYTNGQYRHRLIKVDRSSNIPLYLQQAEGTANQYINLVRFGTHSQSTNTFEVFGNSKINGTADITSNLLVTGNVGIGSNAPTDFLDFGGVGGKNIVFNYAAYGEGRNSLASIIGNNVKASPTGHSLVRRFKNATDEGNFIKLIYNKGVTFHTNITSALNTDISEDTNERMRINLSGNVGVGTTNPTVRLHVVGNGLLTNTSAVDLRIDASSLGDASLTIDRQTTAAESKILLLDANISQWGIAAKSNSNNFVIRDADSTERFTILKTNGNIGIGTTNPITKFHVYEATNGNNWGLFAGNVGATLPSAYTYGVLIGSNYSNGFSESNIVWGNGISSNQYFAIGRASGSGLYSEQLRIDVNGDVGIGNTNPTTLLSVGSAGSTSAASGLTFGADASANLYRSAASTIKTDGSLVVAVNATFAGNVGIGLINPAVKLDVSGGNARFSDYIIIGEDLAYPSNTGSAYLGYSTSPASSPQSNLELIDALSNAIGVNDPLRFRSTISGQYFSGGNWYADPAPLSYGTLLNGNANSYLDLVTSSEYSVGISGKRFVVDQGISYTRPNFILLNTDWNQNFWGFKLNVENSSDLINWTTSISEQTFANNNTRGTIALSVASSIQGGGASRYFRFSFVANQIISTGALRVNKIRSLGNQNYSSTIPVSTSSTGHLIASVGIISPTITSLIGNLAATGSTLDTKINTTNTNLAATGSTLNTKINTLSGYANSTFLSGQGVANWTARWNGTKELITGSIYDIGTAVGIGTTNPLAKLQISRNGDNGSNGLADYGIVTVSSGNITQATLGAEAIGDGYSNLNLGSNIAGVRTFWHISKRLSSTTSPHSLQYFYYNGSTFNELFTFATGGNLGVGTNNPSAKLDIRQTSATTALKVFTNDTSTAYIAQFIGYDNTLGDTTRMVIQAGGSVGIGTLTPASRLAVEGGSISTVNATGTDVKLSFDVRALVGGAVGFNNAAATNVYGVATGLAYLGVAQAYPLVFTTNGTERLRIAAGGNVGIGSTNPAYKLDVNGSAGFTNGITVNADASSTSYFVGANGTRPIIFQNNTASAYDFGFKFTDLNTFTLVGGNTLANPTTDLVSFTYDGKVGIGVTNPSDKIQISGGGISFTSSTGLAVPMLGMTSLNVAYVGPYSTTTDGNAPATVLFNQGASVLQVNFYSSGRAAMTLNRQGRLNIAGNLGNTPPALLNVGPTSSVDAVSGMSFGNDASANLYRSVASTIKTDGSLVVNGNFNTNTTTVTTLNINAGTLNGIPAGSTITGFTYAVNNGNVSQINLVETRFATGSDWTTASTRIQKRTDVTNQAYIEFNPSGASYGMALGVGANSNVEALRILSNGNVGIGTTNPEQKLHISSSATFSAIKFSNSTNSAGIISYFADNFSLYTQNAQRLTIDTNGNVGIGITTPSSLLHLSGAAPIIKMQGSSAAASTKVDLIGTFTTWSLENQYVNGANNDMFRIYNSALSADAITINRATNNVGIGITNPTSKLHISGSGPTTITITDNVLFTNSISNNTSVMTYRVDAGNAAAASAAHIFTRFNTELARIDAAGDLGIGTNNPGALVNSDATYFRPNPSAKFLDLYSDANEADINLISNNSGDGSGIGGIYFTRARAQTDAHLQVAAIKAIQVGTGGTLAGGKLYFYTKINAAGTPEASPQMVINADGNVGIGITNAAAKLHVSGAGATFMRLDSNTLTSVAQFQAKANTDGVLIAGMYGPNPVAGTVFGANTSGAAFLGTTTLATVHPTLLAIGTSNTIPIIFGTNGIERMRVQSDGYVGIGTTSVGSPLEVYGTSMDPSLTASAASIFNVNSLGVELAIGRMVSPPFSLWLQGKHATLNSLAYPIVLNPLGGNVGIGTVSPTGVLTVQSNGTQLRLQTESGPGSYFANISSIYDATHPFTIAVANNSASTSEFFGIYADAGGANNRSVFPNGNVGIGTTSPSGKLTVQGNIEVNYNDSITANTFVRRSFLTPHAVTNRGTNIAFGLLDGGGLVGMTVYNTASKVSGYNSQFIGFNTYEGNVGADERMRITQSGYVGIGTFNPNALLQINGDELIYANVAGAVNSNKLIFGSFANTNAAAIYSQTTSASAGDLILAPVASSVITERVRVKSDGKVGIGTDGPTTLLSVGGAGSASAASGITFGGDASANLYRSAAGTLKTDGRLNIVGDADNSTPDLFFNGAGGFGSAGGQVRAWSPNNTTLSWYWDNTQFTYNNFPLRIVDGSSNVLVYFSATASSYVNGGNLGVGTATPSGKLHVVSSVAGGTVFRADGTNGTLFSVVDDLSDSLMSVNNSAGLPVLEVFADDRVVAGQYGSGDFVLINNKVGIGTSNPVNKLSVIGAASIGSNSYNTSAPTNGLIVEGSVGIGTTSASTYSSKIAVETSLTRGLMVFNTALADAGTLYGLGFGYAMSNYNSAYISFYKVGVSSTSNRLSFSLWNKDDILNINGAGNVGIGVTNPVATLDIKNAASTLPILNLGGGEAENAVSDLYVLNSYNNNSGVGYAAKVIGVNISGSLTATNIPVQRTIWGGVTSATAIALGTDGPRAGTQDNAFQIWTTNDGVAGTQLTQKFSVSSAGDVGIGVVNPACKLDVAGTIRSSTNEIYGFGASDNVSLRAASTLNVLGIYTSNVERLRLAANGYFGVGTDNPSTLLSVGRAGSTLPASGLTFGGDAEANLYRSAEDTIKTDGSLIVAGNVTATNLVSGNGTANYITKWNGTKSIANSQIFDDGTYVGVNTAVNTTYRLQVNGSFAATTKSFDIVHPTISGKRLIYASLEGPENGVYFRGKNDNNEINLPHYWSGLVHDDSITVDLTSVGKRKDGKIRNYSVDQIGHNKVYIYTDSDDDIYDYYYTIFAERKDVSKLVIERDME